MTTGTDDLKPVYLIVSEQQLLVDQAVARLKKRLADVVDLAMDSAAFDAESMDVDEVIAACNTMPFLSERRLVFVRGIEKAQAGAIEPLAAYVADPSPTTVLALVGEKLAKNTRLYKAIDRIGGVVERKAPKRSEFPSAVRSMFADRGKCVSLDTAELFVQTVGRDLTQLAAEIDKVVAFVGKDATEVTRAHVEQVAAHTATRTIFEFTDALADRDCRRALALTDALIADGTSEHALHALAIRRIRELIAARAIMSRSNGSVAVLARELGRAEWQIKRLPYQAREFEPGDLVDLLRAAAEGEVQMKTGRNPRLVLERWIVAVCGA